jgi:anaerobic selenocysteine-containing dehydrogenase
VIATELAHRLDGDLGFLSLDDVWAEIGTLAPSHAGITSAVLAARPNRDGVVAPLGAEPAARAFSVTAADPAAGLVDLNAPGPDTEPTTDQPAEPSAEPGAPAAAAQGTSDVTATAGAGPEAGVADHVAPDMSPPMLYSWDGAADFETPRSDAYALRLVVTRTLYDRAVLTQRSKSLAGLAPEVRAALSSHELERLGIASGDRLRISTPRSSAVLPVVADDGVPRGCVAVPFNVSADGPSEMIDVAHPVVDVKVETV